MFRRRYLTLLGATGLAGCTGSSDDGGDGGDPTPTETPPLTDAGSEPTRTPTDAPTDPPTATPTPEPPEVLFVNLLSHWEEYGDVQANQIDDAPQNEVITIGWREETWIHDGTYSTTTEVEILDSAENRVAINQHPSEQLVDGNGPEEWEGWTEFQATWPPGEYTAEVIVRDDVTDRVSDPTTGTFAIAEPEPKVEILRESRYTGDYDTGVRGVAKNVSDQTLSYAEVSAVFLNSDSQQIGDGIDNTSDLAPGREWQFELQYLGDGDFASYELDTEWRVS